MVASEHRPHETESTTLLLLRKWHGGSTDALSELLERNMPWIRERVRQRLGQQLRRRQDSVDIVQEAALELFRYGPRFTISNETHFRGLLSRIIENVILSEHAKHNAACRALDREHPLPQETVLNLDDRSNAAPDHVAETNEERAWVHLALHLLEPGDQEVIVLRQFRELSFVEIGEAMGASADAVRMRFGRALRLLARTLQQLKKGDFDTVTQLHSVARKVARSERRDQAQCDKAAATMRWQ